MKKLFSNLLLFGVFMSVTSCLTTRDVRYLEPSESLVINEEGLVPYNIPEYRVTQNDILRLDIITTPKGDAAQFYSRLYATGEGGNINTNINTSTNTNTYNVGSITSGNGYLYTNGLKVDRNGEVYVFGIGLIKVEGRTLADIQKEIQEKVNENFLEGKSEVRLSTDGITYYILGDIETTQLTGQKVAYKNNLSLTEAFAMNGGLNRTIDRKNIVLRRKYPEGIKTIRLDLTREDVMNSQYYWIQNGDEIYLSTRAKNINGFGKEPLQTLTTTVSVLTTAMSIYLILTKL